MKTINFYLEKQSKVNRKTVAYTLRNKSRAARYRKQKPKNRQRKDKA